VLPNYISIAAPAFVYVPSPAKPQLSSAEGIFAVILPNISSISAPAFIPSPPPAKLGFPSAEDIFDEAIEFCRCQIARGFYFIYFFFPPFYKGQSTRL
jgi:hypothetical protein